MPIKYTVTYTLPSGTDVSIFDARPVASEENINSVSQLTSTATFRIENTSLIYELIFPTFSNYQSFIDSTSIKSVASTRNSWAHLNNIDLSVNTEYIE